jgi:hypothetical protein
MSIDTFIETHHAPGIVQPKRIKPEAESAVDAKVLDELLLSKTVKKKLYVEVLNDLIGELSQVRDKLEAES